MKNCTRIDEKLLFQLFKKRSNTMDWFMCFITSLGNCSMIWLAFSLFYWIYGDRQVTKAILLSLLLTIIGNNLIIKSLCMRKRPCDKYKDIKMLIKRPIGSSFPSGHAATSFACATAIVAYDLRIGSIALILATLIAISRVYLFVHFPSDVLAGILSGITFGLIGIRIL
ncbi:phosphatase PAP2 family protein [Lachnoclostridium phytofermentans]|uniref:Phosphoesterase PA-phosphatase related n=1 Tax=Lachnoclostridium phytofermentans (strain ATCC 700394 / DSM 18823 / ISDg) TaxID=357809 RepID=A9KTB0_LACP7|nr:phosphatase PAP2 family protein [Lachnoclostridium phytofermentans]ABX43740.1 phosphoesterase PA-phosphatase related [Lachnoclostridium phytofermentans ISDg]